MNNSFISTSHWNFFPAMNIAANQAIYPQTATHLPYHNGAILQNPMQQTASLVRKCLSFDGRDI